MKYLGVSLSSMIAVPSREKKTLNVENILDLIIDVCNSMKIMHDKHHFVYCDATAANILKDDDDKFWLIDFDPTAHGRETSKKCEAGCVTATCKHLNDKKTVWTYLVE